VDPVALGKTRAKALDKHNNFVSDSFPFKSTLCVQLHGDGAFSGQGIVAETLQMMSLPDFQAGGTIHIIVNNQLAFTCDPKNARSGRYSSDVAKMIGCPIFHVNANSPEAILKAMDIAISYRKKFQKDVIIDLIGWRKHGHNELDEPSFTQPLLYEKIRRSPSPSVAYETALKSGNQEYELQRHKIEESYYKFLEAEFNEAENFVPPKEMALSGKWASMSFNQTEPSSTGFGIETLKEIGQASVKLPEGFHVHPRLDKLFIQARLDTLQSGTAIDWATAEALAFGSLLSENYSIRLSGQDSGRGTFSHRHVQLTDQVTAESYVPLNNLGPKYPNCGRLFPVNSFLSELAVLGFEYGYSLENPNNLVIWEAQFGDFFNGAQLVIDTFISCGEDKWLRQSGLVMLLPHGFDGAGPEHSSARIERFLQLSNDSLIQCDHAIHANMHIVYPTTPAQYFHLLRRQMHRNFRKPLIVFSPKTLLRLPAAVSSLDLFGPTSAFSPVLDDQLFKNKQKKAKKLILVSGKLYYDLLNARATAKQEQRIAIVRLEQLAPFPWQAIRQVISNYKNLQKILWVQEEPRNMGPFSFVAPRLQQLLPKGLPFLYVGRRELAAPAVGSTLSYKAEQAELIKSAFE
jgi:probable 2-oxoglutarate dehydrogenase E1 component DHKTD1